MSWLCCNFPLSRSHAPRGRVEAHQVSTRSGLLTIDDSGEWTETTLKQPERHVMWSEDFVPVSSPKAVRIDVEAAVLPNALCSKCQQIAAWLELHQDYYDMAEPDDQPKFHHHTTGLKLEKSYLEGCHLCTLIWHARVDSSSSPENLRQQLRLSNIKRTRNAPFPQIELSKPKSVLKTWKKNFILGAGGSSFIEIGPWSLSEYANTNTLDMWTGSSVGLSDSSSAISTASSSVFQFAVTLLERCVAGHRCCKPSATLSHGLPKRLLDLDRVELKGKVKVVVVDDSLSATKYAALSYCWGKSEGYKLTMSTMKALRSGVKTQHLPRTIQDAIHLTQRLGLRWLWIDSLCIIQDSLEDWAQEAARMCDVYQNCFLCIAASGASSSDDGLFAQRDPLLYQPCQITKGLASSNLFAYPHRTLRFQQDFEECFEKAALYKRGWVMQERLLPPRTLNFGTLLVWECREHYRDEFGLTREIEGKTLKGEFYNLVLKRTPLTQLTKGEERELRDLWHKILEHYTESKLTVRTDKLAALSGVISAFERSTGWYHIAGLWETSLIRDLLWEKKYGRGTSIRALDNPTWSWASLDGGIRLGCRKQNLKLLAKLEVESETARNGSMSQKSEKQIMIRISCTPIRLKEPTNTTPDWLGDFHAVIEWPEANSVVFNSDVNPGCKSAHLFIPLAQGQYPDFKLYGLALAPSSAYPGAYERVGFAETSKRFKGTHEHPPVLFDASRPQIITLV